MKPLYRCRACGFMSTLGAEFTRRNGVLFDKGCLSKADALKEPEATWVREVLEAHRIKASALASSPSPPEPSHA